jgi:hypothetical protein
VVSIKPRLTPGKEPPVYIVQDAVRTSELVRTQREFILVCEVSGSHGGEYESDSFLGHSPGRLRQYARLKRRSTSTKLHGTMSQNVVILVFLSGLRDYQL